MVVLKDMMETKNGHIFVFEGFDRVGKSSLIDLVMNNLLKDGFDVIKIHFPGKNTNRLGEVVDKIHHNQLANYNLSLNPLVRQMLHVCAHIDLEEDVIKPALEKRKIVLLDRFWLSTLAYGRTNGIEENILLKLVNIERAFMDESHIKKLFFIKRNPDFRMCNQLITEDYYKKYIDMYFQDNVQYIYNNDNLSANAKLITHIILEELENDKKYNGLKHNKTI